MIVDLFSTPIYMVNVLDTGEGKSLSEAIDEVDLDSAVEPNKDSWDCKVETGFFNTFKLSKKVKEATEKCVFYHAMLFAEGRKIPDLNSLDMSLDGIWLNRYFQGYSQEPHDHVGLCQISFNYVHRTTTPDNSFKFINTGRNGTDTLWGLSKQFSFCNSQVKLDLRNGDLVLFPSFLVHSVFHRNKNDRITLSGNIIVERNNEAR